MSELSVSSVSEFKKKSEVTLLPSGKRMILKPTSLSTFLQMGKIPNALMAVVQDAIDDRKGKGGKPSKAAEGRMEQNIVKLMEDPEGLADLFETVDAFVCVVAVQPRVYPVPEGEDDRSDELLYVDEMDLDDKMFIFNRAVGEPEDAAPFPEKPASGVGAVQPRKAVGSTTKRSAGARKNAATRGSV